jgi:hypothetical protein
MNATASRDAFCRRSLDESRTLFDNLICGPGESVGLEADENALTVIMASAMGLCMTSPLTNHAIK